MCIRDRSTVLSTPMPSTSLCVDSDPLPSWPQATPHTPAHCGSFKMCPELHTPGHMSSEQHRAWPDDYLLNSGHCTFINELGHPCDAAVGSYWTCSQLKHPSLFHTYAIGAFSSPQSLNKYRLQENYFHTKSWRFSIRGSGDKQTEGTRTSDLQLNPKLKFSMLI